MGPAQVIFMTLCSVSGGKFEAANIFDSSHMFYYLQKITTPEEVTQ